MERVMAQSNTYVANINKLLKDIKSEICSDFIYSDNRGIVITTNKITFASDMNTIEKYMKNLNDVDLNKVIIPRLPQSKSYLKILGISYFINDTNISITTDIMKTVIKSTHIFMTLF